MTATPRCGDGGLGSPRGPPACWWWTRWPCSGTGCMVRWWQREQRAIGWGGVGLAWPAALWLGVARGRNHNVGALSQHLSLFNSYCFQQGFSLSSPTNQAKGGHRVGSRTQDADLQGDCSLTDTHLPIHSCAQDSCPHPWTQGKHPPGSLGLGQRQGSPWTACGLATLPSWGLLPSSPPPGISTKLPVWDNLGIFFWGIVLLHDPSHASHTRSSS